MFENVRQDFRLHKASQSYLGFLALLNYRFGVWAKRQKAPPVRWFLSKLYGINSILTEAITGIHLGRDTVIGEHLHFIHGGPININDEAILGDRVGVMQGVTIGTNTTPEVPTIGNDVFIGANACVLGGVKIGDGARIAANSLVLNDVPNEHIAIGVPAKILPQLPTKKPDSPNPSGQEAST